MTIRVMVATVALALASQAPAAAQQAGTVSVRVVDSSGRPTDGTVTFRGAGTASCRTIGGRCQLQLAAGAWTATLQPVRGQSTGPMRLSVRSGSTAAVTFRTRPATVATTTRVPGARRTVATRRTAPTATRTNQATRRTATTPTTTRRATVTQTRRPTGTQTTATRRTPRVTQTTANRTVTTRRTTTTAPVGPATRRTSVPAAPARNLASGSRVCVQGAVLDSVGRPADVTLTVRQGARTIGTLRSVAGRFSIYDLPPGTYELTSTSVRSGATTRQVLNVSSAISRLTIRTR